MRKGLLNILRGKFLVSGGAPKNWMFIIYVSFLATVMIASSHSADGKVHRIAALDEEVRELRSEFVDMRSDMQELRLESTVMGIVEKEGLFPSETPPKKIKVKNK
ncbi:S-adenosyl-methyltransferase [Arenibacter aquaticus]|uniref:S-adenosyl-methyltransferase n=1 Tax=Arenibacter aquaticus TaxID=2489054 RepID=A0A430K3Y2_9FLAO|nr:FtsL-like putative cell division protein [Arenibacter aquaticus]RTE53624.1 S-adenosyl-methyltransferase [Arenibacter aquaticus]